MAIGSRLRKLTDTITEDAGRIYALYETCLKPKWFPVFFVLSDGGKKTITSIAKEIGHSHPSVSTIIREMFAEGLIVETRDPSDGRRTVVGLTSRGLETAREMESQYEDVTAAIEEMAGQATHDLWEAIGEWEYLLAEKSMARRVEEKKKEREASLVRIVEYEDRYQSVFRALNKEWISAYFEMEERDYRALDNPRSYILDRGGHIFVALYRDEPVGVCALVKMEDERYGYELAKMAVSPKARGKSIGYSLGRRAIEKARETGAGAIYLESNTVLKPAINLYGKLGFVKIPARHTPYQRCNIQMELRLDE